MQKEINKLLKRVNAEKLKNNHKECIELYNIIGGLFTDIASYDEAIHYHEQALQLCKTIGDRLGTAMALRYIGEAKAANGQFYQAIEHIKKYLDLAQKVNNKVEIQRAWTTLGRVYLMQAQEMKENSHTIDSSIITAANEAEKKCQTALNLAESVRDQVDEKEFAQMNSSLLINLGLIKDICGQHNESIVKFNRALDICKKAKLKEDLYRCLIIMTSIFRQRSNIKMSVKSSEEALTIAKQIGKKLLICDAYIECGLVKILQRDFKNAKRTFAQAYLEKSPNEEDHAKAIKMTKISHLIAETYDKVSHDKTASETRLKLCDKLGDLFVSINFYKMAIEFYKRAFTDAKVCSKPKSELARIVYSIAETYADDGQFEHALMCYEKELVYKNGNDKDQCQTLIKIAHMHEYLAHDHEKVCQAYEKALTKADKDPKLMYNVLKDYNLFMKKNSCNTSRYNELENTLLNLKSYPEVLDEIEKEGEEEIEELEDEIADIDDIISDDEDNDEVLMVGRRRVRGTKKFKPNEVGDTPLHEACIKGDIKRVKSLISQGHEVNPRDNAGWIPLHEACNHGHYNIVEYLIESGADVSNRGLKGMSPLHDAATNGHYEIMRILIKNGANVIALTDTGETVLSCLRDYKKRNYSTMSNQEMSEYKQMESELLNVMDKRGYNLMEENMKNLTNKSRSNPSTSSSSSALEEVRPKSRLNVVNQESLSNPVKEYRNTIGTLKRKRFIEEPKESLEKVNLPATYHTGSNTSAPTKEWLIDDVSREKRLAKKTGLLEELLESDDEERLSEPENFEDYIQQKNLSRKKSSNKSKSSENAHKKIIIDIDEDDDYQDDIEIETRRDQKEKSVTPSPCIDDDFSLESNSNTTNNQPTSSLISNQLAASTSKPETVHPCIDLSNAPLTVNIENRKLLIPIKGTCNTIRWLKESIVQRYSALVDAKPVISIAPISDPTCLLYDEDLCSDVIRENIVAFIDSWELQSITDSYENKCSSLSMNSCEMIMKELSRIEKAGNKLDLSFTRFPSNQVKPVSLALARREFVEANFTGCSSIFNGTSCEQEILNSIATWNKLNALRIKCVGLRRSQFETICIKMKFPELRSLDVSVNSIAYKCKNEFKIQLENLLEACPKLKRIDLRKNDLQFMRASSRSEHPLIGSDDDSESLAELLDLKGTHNLRDLKLLGSDQNEYSVYFA